MPRRQPAAAAGGGGTEQPGGLQPLRRATRSSASAGGAASGGCADAAADSAAVRDAEGPPAIAGKRGRFLDRVAEAVATRRRRQAPQVAAVAASPTPQPQPQPPEPARPKRKASDGAAAAAAAAAAPLDRQLPEDDLSDGEVDVREQAQEEELDSPNPWSANTYDSGRPGDGSDVDEDEGEDEGEGEQDGDGDDDGEQDGDGDGDGGGADGGEGAEDGEGGEGGQERQQEEGLGQPQAEWAVGSEPPKLVKIFNKLETMSASACCVAVWVATVGSSKSVMLARHAICISAHLVLSDGHTPPTRVKASFCEFVASEFVADGNAPPLEREYGDAFASEYRAAQRGMNDFDMVGKNFLKWLGEVTNGKPTYLATWAGLDHGNAHISVLCAEMCRRGLAFPTSVTHVLDVEHELRTKLKSTYSASRCESGKLTLLGAIGEALSEQPRCAAVLAAVKATQAAARRAGSTEGHAAALMALQGVSVALAEVRMLAGLCADPDGIRTIRGGKVKVLVKLAATREPWKWANERAAWEAAQQGDDGLPDGWTEGSPPASTPPGSSLNGPSPVKPSDKLMQSIGHDDLSADQLLLKVLTFFLSMAMMEYVAQAVNDKAKETVIRVGNKLCVPSGPRDRSSIKRRKRCPLLVEQPVTVGEMYRMHAFFIYKGFYNPTRIDDLWSNVVPGLRVNAIYENFDKARVLSIISVLSFITKEDLETADTSDSLYKLKPVDNMLNQAAQDAVDLGKGPIATGDEGRCHCQSSRCKVVSRMECKPITIGVTVYMVCVMIQCLHAARPLSYVLHWEWPRKGAASTGGQPTDTKPTDEGNEAETAPTMNLMQLLIIKQLQWCQATLVIDKAFTLFCVLEWCAAAGIAVVGMYKARGRPQNTPRGTTGHWPHRAVSERDADIVPRGTGRQAYASLPVPAAAAAEGERRERRNRADARAGRLWWKPAHIMAEIFRDKKWVSLLATSWFSPSRNETCRRWMPVLGARSTVRVSLALRLYQKWYNVVDLFNKRMAALNMGMGRCKSRFQRQLYWGWTLPAVLCNCITLFLAIYPGAATLAEERRAFGLMRWLHWRCGVVLYKHGVDIDKEGLGTPTTRAAEGLVPVGMPKRAKTARQLETTPAPPRATHTQHQLVNIKNTTAPNYNPKALPKKNCEKNHRAVEWYTSPNHCRACLALCQRLGKIETQETSRGGGHGDGTRSSGVWYFPDELPEGWDHVKAGAKLKPVPTACQQCSTLASPKWLCQGCFEKQDANGEWVCWNHHLRCIAGLRVKLD